MAMKKRKRVDEEMEPDNLVWENDDGTMTVASMVPGPAFGRPVKVIQARPEDVPNHDNELTLVEYDGYHVLIGPAVRGFTVDGQAEIQMLPIDRKGLHARIVTRQEMEDYPESVDSVWVCYVGGARYEAHQKQALKIMQIFWRAAEEGQPAESVKFLIDMMELLDDADPTIVPDGSHRESGLA